jgi:hypothetical protein
MPEDDPSFSVYKRMKLKGSLARSSAKKSLPEKPGPELEELTYDRKKITTYSEERREKKRNKVFAEVRDLPTIDDLLGFERWSDYVTEFISRDFGRDLIEATQITIGVYGEWGSGKTSFLRMVEGKLRAKDIYPIWFDAWKYDKEDNLWAALLQRILDQARVRGKWYQRIWVKFLIWKDNIRLRDGLWEITKKLIPFIIRILLIVISLYVVFDIDKQVIESFLSHWLPNFLPLPGILQANIVKAIVAFIAIVAAGPFNLINLLKGKLGIDFSRFSHKPSYREHIAFLDDFNQEFKHIVSLIGQGKPLVIMIDDLDRCLPEKAIQLLEAIKAFLDVEGCVFLLGLDKRIIGRAIASKYKDLFVFDEDKDKSFYNKRLFSEDYMAKIIQLSISLPLLNQEQIKDYVANLSSDEDITQCASIFEVGLPPNPRKIKLILRTFLFIRDMIYKDIKRGNIKSSLLAKLILLQSQFSVIFDAIVANPSLLQYLEMIGYSQHESQTEINSNIRVEEENKVIREQAEKYIAEYPGLSRILLTNIGEGDTFIKVDMHRYISLIGFLAVVRTKVGLAGVVPNLQKLDLWTATEHVRESGLRLVIVGEESTDLEPGRVVRQAPSPGTAMDEGGEIQVMLSKLRESS